MKTMKCMIAVFAALLFTAAYAQEAAQPAEQNKDVVRALIEAVNEGNLDAAEEHIAEGIVGYNVPPGLEPGGASARQFLTLLRNSVQGLEITIEDLIAERDRVAARLTVRGNWQHEILGAAPTGEETLWTGIFIFRVTEGQIAEYWAEGSFGGLGPRITP